MTPLFDVVISVSGDDETRALTYDVNITDTRQPSRGLIGYKVGMTSLDEAIQFAKGAVTAFIEGVQGG